MLKNSSELIPKLIYSPKRRIHLFRQIPTNKQGEILLNLSKHLQQNILTNLKDKEILGLLHYLDPDEITDLLQNIKKRRRNKLIKKLSEDIKEKVEFLLRFDPRTAAGLMSLDYVGISKGTTFKQVSKVVKKHEKITGKFPTILVVENGNLKGELPGHILALYSSKEKIDKHIKRVPTIRYDKDEKEIIRVFKKHKHGKLVVLDRDKSILGIIYSDDILRIIEKHSGNHLYDFAGVRREEDIYDSVLDKVRNRYKWLIVNLGTAFLAASVISYFQNTISAFVLLAVYMPIIAGMGGNAGVQTLAVMVRGLTLKEIEIKIGKKIILHEIGAGIINGIIVGLLVSLAAILLHQTPLFGLVVGAAMVINLIIASLFGVIIPLLMKKLGRDPASSSGIFITTATDVGGFFVFLGLATLILF